MAAQYPGNAKRMGVWTIKLMILYMYINIYRQPCVGALMQLTFIGNRSQALNAEWRVFN